MQDARSSWEIGESEVLTRWERILVFGSLAVGEYGQFRAVAGVLPDHEACLAVLREGRLTKIVTESQAAATRLREKHPTLGPLVVSAGRGTMVREALSDLRCQTDADVLKPSAVGVCCTRAAPDRELAALEETLGSLASRELTLAPGGHSESLLGQARANLTIADACLAGVPDMIRAGATAGSLVRRLESRVRSEGAVATVIIAGGRAPLQPPDDVPIRRGDVVSVCVEFADASGAWTESAMLFSWGSPVADGLASANQLHAVLRSGIDSLRPGRRADEVATAMLDRLSGSGYAVPFGLGHGVGIDETPPVISPEDRTVLQPGMVLALHPSIEANDGRALFLAETVLVTDADPEPLRRGYEPAAAIFVFD